MSNEHWWDANDKENQLAHIALDRVALEKPILGILHFPLSIIIPLMFHIHSSVSRRWKNFLTSSPDPTGT
jgi:hypothetical protein